MNLIHDFCRKRMCDKKITDAFVAYCKASISGYYQIGGGTTVTGILMSFSEKEIEKMWGEFVVDLSRILPKQGVS